MPHDEWFWCTRHQQVEPTEGCEEAVRMGPYATREEAERALDTAHARTEAWDEEDARWDGN